MNEKNNHKSNLSNKEDYIDLKALFIFWFRWSWVAIPLIIIGLYLGYSSLKKFVPVYTATLIVQSSGGQTIQSTQSQLINIFAGQGSSSNSGESFSRLKQIIKSPTLANHLQKKYGLLQIVYKDNWDTKTKEWIIPSGKKFERSESRKKFFKQPQWSPPSIESLAIYLGGRIEFKDSRDLPFTELVVSDIEPQKAKQELEMIFYEADYLIRKIDREETLIRSQYLEKKLSSVTNIDKREALLSLLAKEESKLMFMDSDDSYTAKVVDQIQVSIQPTSPNIRNIFAIPIIASLVLGIAFLTLIWLFIKES
ncbi:hypothetical protein OAK17_07070 [Alphaproteobacteria bacterium]|nr:hypothetical protein [Alphaproteobacteria bacterium]